jgi:uncharacterized membrane protein YoaK (UPF0700 family)
MSLIKWVLFRFFPVAFGACILVQVLLWAALLGGISALFADSFFIQAVNVVLFFLGLFAIGDQHSREGSLNVPNTSLTGTLERSLAGLRKETSAASSQGMNPTWTCFIKQFGAFV